jgi:two-component system NtrC family sensor kinase
MRAPDDHRHPESCSAKPGAQRAAALTRLREAWARSAGFRGLWLVALLLPLAGFGGAALLSWGTVEAEARARLVRTVEMLHGHALGAFETQEAVLIALDERVRGMGWQEIGASAELHGSLARLDAATPSTAGLLLVAPDGRLALGSRLPLPPPRIDLSARDHVRAHRRDTPGGPDGAGTFVGIDAADPAAERRSFTLSRPRQAEDGRPDGGVIAASFGPEHFEAFYAAVADDPRNTALLARTDGAVLAMHPPPGPDGRFLPADAPLAAALRDAGEEPRVLRLQGQGGDRAERLVALRRMAEGYPVVLAYGVHVEALRQVWYGRLIGPGLGTAAVAALLLWLTARAQDAARRGRIEAERRAELEARLRQSEAVAALGQLAAGVAHDFGNAVQSVTSGVRLLERHADDPAQVRRIAGLISGAADRGAALAGRMLGFARRGAMQPDAAPLPLDPASALAEVSELLRRTLGAGIRVAVTVLDPPPPPIRADRAELEATVVNLAVNARDAMPGGGDLHITLAGETVTAGETRRDVALRPGRYARIAVRDTGEGMDAATLARAGEAFFTSKPEGRGTGLGLSMARGFAGRAGGALRIESAPGRGTEVTLWLAAAEDVLP